MHFSKTYAQLLVTLPPELRNNAFEYRKLKQLINQTAFQLESLGLGPSVLRSMCEHPGHDLAHLKEQDDSESVETPTMDSESVSDASHRHIIVYEIILNSSVPEPRLRLSSRDAPGTGAPYDAAPSTTKPTYSVDLSITEQSLRRITGGALSHPIITTGEEMSFDHLSGLIIPLPSDTAFFQLLTSTLSSLSDHSDTIRDNFKSTLTTLARSISLTARPASSSSPHSFSAYSITADNSTSLRPQPGGLSDLSTWREIFHLYAEVEVFESITESTRGEKTTEEVEKNLKLFRTRIQEKIPSLVLPGSREAFDTFMDLNLFILDVKKFQFANSEAIRKILKKHAKRTMLPVPAYVLERNAVTSAASPHQVALISHSWQSLPRLLVQAVGEVLLPIIPHIDDYACLICTSIAFKPVRLGCGHFFCVRCLVKMQKRGMGECPMCRAPTVLLATPSNIDYGLLNIMADWFPVESLEKLRANEQEVIQEQLEVFGIADIRVCQIM